MVRKSLTAAVLAGFMMLASGTAHAASITFSSNIVPIQSTNWASSLNFQQFNPALGTLTNILLKLSGTIFGNVQVESLDANPSTVTSNLGGSVTLTRPDTSTLVVVLPVVSSVDNLGAFDGVIDWAGTSGVTHPNLQNTVSNTVNLASASDLALFSGLGSIALPVSALATSNAAGSGNLVTLFQTQAGAVGEITYTYDPPSQVPEPASLLLVGGGLIGLARRWRRQTA